MFDFAEQIYRRIRQETWRLQRRRHLPKFPVFTIRNVKDTSETLDDRPSSPEGVVELFIMY